MNDDDITFSLMCFRSRSPIRLRHSHHLKLLFLCFSVTLVKPEKPLKVPEVEKFYKLPDSRAVVKFRINTGFTASCFFGTLLVAFAQIKDFYILIRCSVTIVSTVLSFSQQSSCISLSPKYTGKRNFMCFRNLPSGCSCS